VSALEAGDGFGRSFSLDGNRLAVGADADDGSGNATADAGAVYLFTFSDSVFTGANLEGVIGAGYSGGKNYNVTNLEAGDEFARVSLNGNRLAVGVVRDGGSGNSAVESGAVYLFSFADSAFSNPTGEAIIGRGYTGGKNVDMSSLDTVDHLGSAVALRGNRLAAGAHGDDGSGNATADAGAAYLFTFSDSVFSGGTVEGIIGAGYTGGKNLDISSNLEANDNLARVGGVALGESVMIVAASADDGAGNLAADSGAVYLVDFADNTFNSPSLIGIIGKGYVGGANVDVSSLDAGDLFGSGLSGDVSRLVIAARMDDGSGEALADSGAVYFFKHGDPIENASFSIDSAANHTIAPSTLEKLLSSPQNVELQANNDITVSEPVTVNNPSGNGGSFTLTAGRSVFINANITTDNGDLDITANELAANGVVDAQRDAGIAEITMAPGTTLNVGSGAMYIAIREGTGLTFSNSGHITLDNLVGGIVEVHNGGPTAGSSIWTASGASLIQAGAAAFKVDGAGGGGQIGKLFEPLRLTVTDFKVWGQSGGVYLDSPSQGINIGALGLVAQVGAGGVETLGGGEVKITAAGAITQTEPVSISGPTTFDTSGANDVTLTDSANTFATVAFNANNVSVTDADATDLGASTIAGTLSVTSGGDITQSSALAVTGTTTLNANSGLNNINLPAANSFASVLLTGNDVSISTAGAVDLGDATVTTLAINAGDAVTTSGTVTVSGAGNFWASTDITLVNMTFGGDLTVNANGNITQSGLTVGGILNESAGVALTDSGGLNVTGDATLATSSGDINLADATVGGTLTLNSAAALLHASSTTVTAGTLSETAGGNIDLNTVTINTVSGASLTSSGGTVTLTGSSFTGDLSVTTWALDITQSGLTVTGNLTETAGVNLTDGGGLNVTGDVTLSASGDVSLTMPNITGYLTVNASGNIVQSAVTVGGNLNESAGINLTDSGMSVSGDASLSATGDASLAFSDVTGNLTVNAANITQGGLSVGLNLNEWASGFIADNGSGASSIGTDATLSTTAGDIVIGDWTVGGTLTINSGGNLTTGSLDVTGDANATGNAISFGDMNILGNASVTGSSVTGTGTTYNFGGDLTINSGSAVELGMSISGNLYVTAGGDITDGNTVTVGGTAVLDAGSNNILLDSGLSTFGELQLTGNNVSVASNGPTVLGASTISGNFSFTASGITQSGAVSVGGASSIDAGGGNLVLDNWGNAFTGSVTLNAVVGGVTFVNGVATDLASVNAVDLDIQSGDAITDSGTLAVTGQTSFTSYGSGASGNIILDDPSSFFGNGPTYPVNLWSGSGSQVSIRTVNSIELGSVYVGGDLTVQSDWGITQGRDVTVFGASSFTSGNGADINLYDSSGFYYVTLSGPVTFNASRHATLVNATSTDLGASVVNGDLAVVSSGNVTQSGALTVTGTATVDAGGYDITLDDAGNQFGKISLFASNATIVEADDTTLGDSTIPGTLTITSGGAITEASLLDIGTLAMTSGGAITLTDPQNQFGALGNITRGGALDLYDSDGGLYISGSIDSGSIDNPVTIQTDWGDLTLGSGVIIATTGAGNDITLVTDNAGFINYAGPGALSTSGGRYLLYTYDSGYNDLGGLLPDFEEFQVSYPTPPQDDNTGNGVLYSFTAPPPAQEITFGSGGEVVLTLDDGTTVTFDAGAGTKATTSVQTQTQETADTGVVLTGVTETAATGSTITFSTGETTTGLAAPSPTEGSLASASSIEMAAAEEPAAPAEAAATVAKADETAPADEAKAEDKGEKKEGAGEKEKAAVAAGAAAGPAAGPAKDDAVCPAGGCMTMGGGAINAGAIAQMPPVLQQAISIEIRNELQSAIGGF
ncbi:MAG: hypothetical protein HY360_17855, partial [Verrucomicrobia bacterium]|nr:hypothetical protein [Verrucomicrobiota bacterium]